MTSGGHSSSLGTELVGRLGVASASSQIQEEDKEDMKIVVSATFC